MGAIFYLVMDMAIHWGVLRHLRAEVEASAPVLVTAIVLDALALAAFLFVKGSSDPLIVGVSLSGIAIVFAFERFFLRRVRGQGSEDGHAQQHGEDHDS